MVGLGKLGQRTCMGKREKRKVIDSPQVEGTGTDRPPAEPPGAPPASIVS